MDAEQQAQEAAATAALQADAQSQTKEVASNQAPEQTSCTQCHEPVNQTDVFCGNCGTKLK